MAGLLRLALHVVIVVVAASSADEERRREKRSRAGTNLLDGGNVLRERRGVDEDLLLESANSSAFWLIKDILAPVASANGTARGRIVSKRRTGVFGSSSCRVYLPCVRLMGCLAGQCIDEVERPLRLTELNRGPNWSAMIGRLPRSARRA